MLQGVLVLTVIPWSGAVYLQVSLVKVGITLLLLQRFEDSVWVFREALTVRKNALGALHPSTARIYNNLGCVHVEFNELREARRAFEAALDIQRNALSDDPQSGPLQFAAATTLCNLGYLYRNQEMHEKAALVLREALGVSDLGFIRLLRTFCIAWNSHAFASPNSAPRERYGEVRPCSLIHFGQPC